MIVYQQYEFLLFVLHSFLGGVALGAFYDILRLSRLMLGVSTYSSRLDSVLYEKSYPLIGRMRTAVSENKRKRLHGSIILFVEDMLFMLVSALLVLCIAFFRNDGKVRMVTVAFTVLGFLCYYISIGKLVITFSSVIVFGIRFVFAYVIFFLTYPIKLIFRLIRTFVGKILGRLNNRHLARIIAKKGRKELMRIFSLADIAFIEEFKTHKIPSDTDKTEKNNRSEKQTVA